MAITAAELCTIQVISVPDQEEDYNREMTLCIKRTKEIDNRRIMFQIESLTRTTQQNEREEEEGDTKKEISEITALLTINQHNAEEETQGIRQSLNLHYNPAT